MIAALIVLVLSVITLIVLLTLDDEVCEPTSLDRVRDELFVADQRIDSEFHQARRAMNDAAGQSWRNLAG